MIQVFCWVLFLLLGNTYETPLVNTRTLRTGMTEQMGKFNVHISQTNETASILKYSNSSLNEFQITCDTLNQWIVSFEQTTSVENPSASLQYTKMIVLNISKATDILPFKFQFTIEAKVPNNINDLSQRIYCLFKKTQLTNGSFNSQMKIFNQIANSPSKIVNIIDNFISFNLMDFWNTSDNLLCITKFKFQFTFQSKASIAFGIGPMKPSRQQESEIQHMAPFTIHRYEKQYDSFCYDYSMLQLDQQNSMIISTFFWQNPLISQKAVHSIGLEYINGIWPSIGSVTLPVKVTPQLQLYSSYQIQIRNNPHQSDLVKLFFSLNIEFVCNNNMECNSTKRSLAIYLWRNTNREDIGFFSDFTNKTNQFTLYKKGENFFYFLANNLTKQQDFEIMSYVHQLNISQFYNMKIVKVSAKWQSIKGYGTATTSNVGFRFLNLFEETDSFTNRQNRKKSYYSAIGGYGTLRTISDIVSIPNIGPLLQLTPFILLVDDFSYFVYHTKLNYDAGFEFISQLCWNLTHSKWEPPSAILQAMNISLSSTESRPSKWILDNLNRTPLRLQYQTQDIFFINNCKGYILYTLPSSAIIFTILWKIHWRFYQNKKLAALLRSFSSWSFFGVSIIADNTQFLSFRGFSQLRFLVPNGFFGCISLFLGALALAVVVICMVSLYTLSLRWARSTFHSVLFKRTSTAYTMLSIGIGVKAVEGFVHATIDTQIIRAALLLGLQLTMVVSLTCCAFFRVPRYKSTFSALTACYVLRLVLYSVLMIEVFFKDEINLNNVNNMDTGMSSLTLLILQLIFVCNTIQIVCGCTVCVFVINAKKNFVSQQVPNSHAKTTTTISKRPLKSDQKNSKSKSKKEIIKTQIVVAQTNSKDRTIQKINQSVKKLTNALITIKKSKKQIK